jgi:hypothetical protein
MGRLASHAACVRAVMLRGGISALEPFWRDYKGIGDAVRTAGGMPAGAEVIPLGRQPNRVNNGSSQSCRHSPPSDHD